MGGTRDPAGGHRATGALALALTLALAPTLALALTLTLTLTLILTLALTPSPKLHPHQAAQLEERRYELHWQQVLQP